ncbi:hypothetical protein [Paucisalibacillus sp. EB02]|nr:hypothetical protein [Paucisalibacillus sp. EB02]
MEGDLIEYQLKLNGFKIISPEAKNWLNESVEELIGHWQSE